WIGWMIGTSLRVTSEMPGKVWGFITSMWNRGVALLKEGKDKAVDTFKQLVVDAILWVQHWWRDTTEKIKTGIADAIIYVKSLPKRVKEELTRLHDEAMAKMSAFVDGVVDWCYKLPGRAWSAVKGLGPKVKDAVSDAGTWLVNAGENIVNGAIDGFKKKAKAMLETVKGWGRDIVSGFNSAVGNRSPSYLFHAAAGNVVQGFANGVDDHKHLAVDAMNRMGKALVLDASVGLGIDVDGSGAGGVGAPGALLAGWRPPTQATAAERNIRVEVPVHVDGKEVYRAIVPHSQQHKDRNGTTQLD